MDYEEYREVTLLSQAQQVFDFSKRIRADFIDMTIIETFGRSLPFESICRVWGIYKDHKDCVFIRATKVGIFTPYEGEREVYATAICEAYLILQEC